MKFMENDEGEEDHEGLPPFVQVDPTRLSEAALRGVVEDFVSREGTDYGFESRFEDKIASVMHQLVKGAVLIVYSVKDQSTTILTRRDFEKMSDDAVHEDR